MLVTNQTDSDYWFGPLHLPAGKNQQITVDDTSATSLYLTSDAVADAINNLAASGKITVSSEAQPFPRPTGTPSLMHGDGSPEGLVYAPQGSVYMRRDGTLTNGGPLYLKTSGITSNTKWLDLATASGATAALPVGTLTAFAGSDAPDGWLLCDGSAVSRAAYSTLFGLIGTTYGDGDGTTTFNVPDLRGRVPVGEGTNADVSTLGADDGLAVGSRSPKHNSTNGVTASHSLTLPNHGHSDTINFSTSTEYLSPSSTNGYDFSTSYAGHSKPATAVSLTKSGAVGNPTSHPAIDGSVSIGGSIGPGGSRPIDAPAYVVLNYIIKT